jgi:aryl-phospho-beta-D-glucosidase BglC (GH1 family)
VTLGWRVPRWRSDIPAEKFHLLAEKISSDRGQSIFEADPVPKRLHRRLSRKLLESKRRPRDTLIARAGELQEGNMMTNLIRSFKAKAAACICLALVSIGAGQTTPVSLHGLLKVKGNRIVNKDGQPVTLHGMSMYAWANQGLQYYNATAVRRLVQEWKCTVIRIPILPARVSTQKAQLRTVVDACIANGVYAIIDWHSMENANADAASAFFKEMATAYGNTPNVMYEPWNEPVQETWPTIKAYHEKVIKAIREVDPDNIIICGNPQWDQRSDLAAASPITISTNIAYSVHFYAATHRQSMRNYAATALSKGIALFSTEYGTSEASGSGNFDAAETRLWWDFLHENGVGTANWSVSALGETSAAFKTGTSSTDWTDADLKPSGTLVKAFIQSKYQGTVGIDAEGSRRARQALDQERFLPSEGTAEDAYTVIGSRITRVKARAGCGVSILRRSPNGNALSVTLSR